MRSRRAHEDRRSGIYWRAPWRDCLARTLDDGSNLYRYENESEWSGDGTAFCEDNEGRVIFGPWGRRIENHAQHEHRVQHAAAASRLAIPPHEYTARQLGGQERWCWYRH